MTTSFPTSIDNFTNPNAAGGDTLASVPHDAQHANINDAVKALETKVGVNSSVDTNSLDYKIRNSVVSSFNTRTGAVTLTDSDVTNAIGTPSANKVPTIDSGTSLLAYTYALNQNLQTVDSPTFAGLTFTSWTTADYVSPVVNVRDDQSQSFVIASHNMGGYSITPSWDGNGYWYFHPDSGSYRTRFGLTEIYGGDASKVTLTVKGASSQTGDLQQWQDSSGTPLASIDYAGSITAPTLTLNRSAGALLTFNGAYGNFVNTAGILYFDNPTSNEIRFRTGSGYNTALKLSYPTSGYTAQVTVGDPGDAGLVVKGAASQTADLTEWQDSNGTPLSSVDKAGHHVMVTGSGAPTSTPADGAIYIDTTNSKLYARIGGAWKSTTLT